MLVPARLLLPPALAARWPAMVARAGFVVERDGPKALLGCGKRSLVMHFEESPRHTLCDLSLVTDRESRRRIEAMFLSSGASFEDASLISTHLRALYRIDETGWRGLVQRLASEDIRIEAVAAPRCPNGEPFAAGSVRRAGARLPFETGPALALDGETPALFIDLLPRFLILPSRSLRALIERCHQHLLDAGAASIYPFSSPT